MSDASGEPGETRIFSLTHACEALHGLTIFSLAIRGNHLEIDKNNKNEIPMKVSPEIFGEKTDVEMGAKQALTNSESTDPTVKEITNAVGPPRKNRSGAMRIKARRGREKTQAELPPISGSSTTSPKTLGGGA